MKVKNLLKRHIVWVSKTIFIKDVLTHIMIFWH